MVMCNINILETMENGQEQSLRLWFSENISFIEFDDEGVPKSDQIDCMSQQTYWQRTTHIESISKQLLPFNKYK